jgi:hypothetical protein
MKTLQQRYTDGLTALGHTRIYDRNGRIVFHSAAGGRYYFLGSNGSFRFNTRLAFTGSIPVSDKFKKKVLAAPAIQAEEQLTSIFGI